MSKDHFGQLLYLIKNAECENSQQIQSIEQEREKITKLKIQLEGRTRDTRLFSEEATRAKVKCVQREKKLMQISENLKSLKQTGLVLEEHMAVTRKKIALKEDEYRIKRQQYSDLLAKYQTIWTHYEEKYRTFPRVKEFEASLTEVERAREQAQAQSQKIEQLERQINSLKLLESRSPCEEALAWKDPPDIVVQIACLAVDKLKIENKCIKNRDLLSSLKEKIGLARGRVIDLKGKDTSVCVDDGGWSGEHGPPVADTVPEANLSNSRQDSVRCSLPVAHTFVVQSAVPADVRTSTTGNNRQTAVPGNSMHTAVTANHVQPPVAANAVQMPAAGCPNLGTSRLPPNLPTTKLTIPPVVQCRPGSQLSSSGNSSRLLVPSQPNRQPSRHMGQFTLQVPSLLRASRPAGPPAQPPSTFATPTWSAPRPFTPRPAPVVRPTTSSIRSTSLSIRPTSPLVRPPSPSVRPTTHSIRPTIPSVRQFAPVQSVSSPQRPPTKPYTPVSLMPTPVSGAPPTRLNVPPRYRHPSQFSISPTLRPQHSPSPSIPHTPQLVVLSSPHTPPQQHAVREQPPPAPLIRPTCTPVAAAGIMQPEGMPPATTSINQSGSSHFANNPPGPCVEEQDDTTPLTPSRECREMDTSVHPASSGELNASFDTSSTVGTCEGAAVEGRHEREFVHNQEGRKEEGQDKQSSSAQLLQTEELSSEDRTHKETRTDQATSFLLPQEASSSFLPLTDSPSMLHTTSLFGEVNEVSTLESGSTGSNKLFDMMGPGTPQQEPTSGGNSPFMFESRTPHTTPGRDHQEPSNVFMFGDFDTSSQSNASFTFGTGPQESYNFSTSFFGESSLPQGTTMGRGSGNSDIFSLSTQDDTSGGETTGRGLPFF